MSPTATLSGAEAVSLREQEQRQLLSSVMRQHESAVFTYLYRRVRRSVELGPLAQDVFSRLVAEAGLTLPREELRNRLVELCQEVLLEFVRNSDRQEAAWTELCLELDALARDRQAGV